MNLTVVRRHLTDNLRGFLGWALSITAVAAMYSSMWPVMTGSSGLATAVDSFPKAMRDAFHLQDYGTAAGYFGSTVFGLLVPVLVAVFAIAAGARAIAGDEEAGTLDLVMTHPVRRTQLAVSRLLAVLTAIVATGTLLLAVELAIRVPAGFTALGVGGLAAMSLQLVLFGVCFASVAFGIGACTGRRVYAIGGGAYLAVAAYLSDSFLPQIRGLHWTQYGSPFYWYLGGEPLRHGIQWTHCALLAGVALGFALVGLRGFDRRDLAQGG
jgi:ABC-2 type transport system permease protein